MQGIPLYQNHGVASKAYIELAGSASEGVRLPVSALLVASRLPDGDPQKPVLTGYADAYEKAFAQPVSAFGGGAYDGLMMVVNAIKRANSADPQKIRDALEQTKGFVGTAGVVNMSAQDHMGLSADAFKLVVIKGGDWSLVAD
jgi:branched-chain amino acid transport system substrate-binding protein